MDDYLLPSCSLLNEEFKEVLNLFYLPWLSETRCGKDGRKRGRKQVSAVPRRKDAPNYRVSMGCFSELLILTSSSLWGRSNLYSIHTAWGEKKLSFITRRRKVYALDG